MDQATAPDGTQVGSTPLLPAAERAAVFPKGRWGCIDSDRCWCRNREHLLKVHRLDRDWDAMEGGGGDVRQQEYGWGIGTGPKVEEQKVFRLPCQAGDGKAQKHSRPRSFSRREVYEGNVSVSEDHKGGRS